jgi:hypothetical protein
MKRTLWFLGLVVVLVPRARGDESSLAVVPAKSPVVLYCHGIDRTKERLVNLIKNAAPELAAMIEAQMESGLKQAMKERELKGLAKDGPIFLAMTELPEGEENPTGAAIVRVTNYAEFRDGLLTEEERKGLKKDPAGFEVTKCGDTDIYFVSRGDYAIVTSRKDTAEYFTKQHEGLDAKISPDLGKRLLDSDVALYVDMVSINKKYGERMQGHAQEIVQAMQSMQSMQGGGPMDKNSAETMQSMINGFVQFLSDSKSFVFAAEFRAEGLALHNSVRVSQDSSTNSILKESKNGTLADVGKLPKGKMVYGGVQFGPELAKLFSKVVSMATGGKADISETLAGADLRAMYMDYSMPMEEIQVWQSQDPAKAVEFTLKLYEALEAGSKLHNAPIKGKPEIKRDAESDRGFKFNSMHIEWDFEKMGQQPGAQMMLPTMKKMLGTSLNTWFGTDGKSYVQITAKDWDSAKKHLEEYLDGKNPVADEAAFTSTRSQLPAEVTGFNLFDSSQFIVMIAQFMGPFAEAAGAKVQVVKGDTGKSFFGVAFTLKPQTGAIDLWFPISFFKEISKVATQGGGDGQP